MRLESKKRDEKRDEKRSHKSPKKTHDEEERKEESHVKTRRMSQAAEQLTVATGDPEGAFENFP